MTDFEKVSDYLISISVGRGLYAMELIDVSMDEMKFHGSADDNYTSDKAKEMLSIYSSWSEKDEAAFLIYFGSECMKRLEEN